MKEHSAKNTIDIRDMDSPVKVITDNGTEVYAHCAAISVDNQDGPYGPGCLVIRLLPIDKIDEPGESDDNP